MNNIDDIECIAKHQGLQASLEFHFTDPDNRDLGWFRDVYLDSDLIGFTEIVTRAADHPNYFEFTLDDSNVIKKELLRIEYEKSKLHLIKLLCAMFDINIKHDIHYLKEISEEIRKHMKGINISHIYMDEMVYGGYDTPEWTLTHDVRNQSVILRSPKMSAIDAHSYLNDYLKFLYDSSIADLANGFRFKFYHNDYNIRHINWFKIATCYNTVRVFKHFDTMAATQRKREIHRMFFQLNDVEIKMNMQEILNPVIDTFVNVGDDYIGVETSNNISNLMNSFSSDDELIRQKEAAKTTAKILKYYRRACIALITGIDPDYMRYTSMRALIQTVRHLRID